MRTLILALSLATFSCPPKPAERVLRVCADPDNLPFSDKAEHGFENRIARMLGDELGARVQYTWRAMNTPFEEQGCDVVIGVPVGPEEGLTTRPYYRSSYVFLTRADRQLYFRSLDDPRLQPLKIGLELDTPLAFALERRGISNVVGFPGAPASLIAAVEQKEVDVGLVWGPMAGAFARGDQSPLRISVINPSGDDQRFSFDVCMGVSKSHPELKAALDRALEHRRADISAILREYGVPLASLQ